MLSLKCSIFRDSFLQTILCLNVSCRGLLKPWFTFKGEDPSFKQGDKVKAGSELFGSVILARRPFARLRECCTGAL